MSKRNKHLEDILQRTRDTLDVYHITKNYLSDNNFEKARQAIRERIIDGGGEEYNVF